jgi:hypothetical protein
VCVTHTHTHTNTHLRGRPLAQMLERGGAEATARAAASGTSGLRPHTLVAKGLKAAYTSS